jgi:maltose/maltodextrin transport system permease protein
MYEAADIDGAGTAGKFFNMTLPSILPTMLPLLVGSFAFNFNNFMLVFLLTAGGPPMAGVETIAGETDLLVTYTYRLAFRDSAANFGYASAISTIIFLVVALLAYVNLKLSTRKR